MSWNYFHHGLTLITFYWCNGCKVGPKYSDIIKHVGTIEEFTRLGHKFPAGLLKTSLRERIAFRKNVLHFYFNIRYNIINVSYIFSLLTVVRIVYILEHKYNFFISQYIKIYMFRVQIVINKFQNKFFFLDSSLTFVLCVIFFRYLFCN